MKASSSPLFSNKSSSQRPFSTGVQPPKPKPFDMTEPFFDRGLWCFWLTAEAHVLDYVGHLHCILNTPAPFPFQRRPQGRQLFTINPRYDHQEAWLFIYDSAEAESKNVELNEIWEKALEDAPTPTDDPPSSDE